MTKHELQAWQKRWNLVEEIQLQELRDASLADKLRQFETLRVWAKQMGWGQSLRQGDEAVRLRWARLKDAYRGR